MIPCCTSTWVAASSGTPAPAPHRTQLHFEYLILEHFSDAVHIGLTATPKRESNVDTYDYFGEPVYTYSLQEGKDRKMKIKLMNLMLCVYIGALLKSGNVVCQKKNL